MSVKLTSQVWEAVDLVTERSDCMLLLALADWANDRGDVYTYSVEHLAKKARMGERNARYIMDDLMQCEVLEKIIGRGRGKKNYYRLRLENLQRLHLFRTSEKGAKADTKGCNDEQKGCNDEQIKGAAADSFPIKVRAQTLSKDLTLNKKTLKENTHTDDGADSHARARDATSEPQKHLCVCGAAYFLDELEEYARQMNLGAGWVTAAWRGCSPTEPFAGHVLFKRWLDDRGTAQPAAAAVDVDTSACPDCKGSGMYYPQGFDKGVARCKHERLKTAGGGV